MAGIPRILTVQDISCVGQCSATVALPVISACGVEACIMPSAILSTHTGGFHGFTFRDLTADMPGIERHWLSEGIRFQAVTSGYLASAVQIDIVRDLMERLLLPGGVKIVDPAMADHGKLYYGFDHAFVAKMSELCAGADYILPNLTEACLLTGTPYRQELRNPEEIRALLMKLGALGPSTVVLKGLSSEDGKLGNAVYEVKNDRIRYYFTGRIEKNSHGTGDCFAAAFTGALMRGLDAYDAMALATDFVVECLRQTMKDPEHWYGISFERALPLLIGRLSDKESGA